MKHILVLALSVIALGCEPEPCRDTTTVIQSSFVRDGQATCSHPQHRMTTSQVGLTRGSVKVVCTCPR